MIDVEKKNGEASFTKTKDGDTIAWSTFRSLYSSSFLLVSSYHEREEGVVAEKTSQKSKHHHLTKYIVPQSTLTFYSVSTHASKHTMMISFALPCRTLLPRLGARNAALMAGAAAWGTTLLMSASSSSTNSTTTTKCCGIAGVIHKDENYDAR